MLTVKQENFCVEIIQHGNASQAYKAAFNVTNDGTARANASRLLRKPEVQERLRELADKTVDERICGAVELKEFLTRVVRRECVEEIYLPNGERIQRANSVKDALKAAETLAKISGLFVNRAEVDLSVANVPIVIRDDI